MQLVVKWKENHYFYEDVNAGMLSKFTLLLSYLYTFFKISSCRSIPTISNSFPLFFIVLTLFFVEINMELMFHHGKSFIH